jgi:DNA repair protein RadC
LGVDHAEALVRVQQLGLQSVPIHDLLAIMLSREETDVEQNEAAALDLVKRHPGTQILDIGQHELQNKGGLEPFEGLRILAAIELGRRVAGNKANLVTKINGVEDAFELFAWIGNEDQEHFCAAFLNSKGEVLSTRVIHIGTLNMSVVGAREVFREAVRENAASVIVAHNHPSGDPTPSPEDIAITRKLIEVGELLDVKVLDHVIIGSKGNISLMREGQI